ncbi:MAG: UDP-N-acetylglucosamine diphosphorylase [Verrucomicrobiota bacterium]|nr:UDP-N-acetylglucosamine diphosphorylase [Verrucomicrobiota bacterium]
MHLDAYLSRFAFVKEIKIPEHVYLEFPERIAIGKGTVIEPGVYIQGPCIIGENCILRHGAYIRNGVIMGNHCAIGHAAEVKHSILLNYAAAAHFTYVGDSILGNRVNLGAGVKCANLRLDRRPVVPGLSKFGTCIGDSAQVGCNAVLNPGTLIGRDAIIYPLQSVSGFVAPHQRVGGKAHAS